MGLRPWLLSPSTSSQWKALVVGTLAGPLPQSSRRSRDHAYNHSQTTCQLWQAYHLPGRYTARPVSRLTSLHPAWDPATLYNALLSPSLLGHVQHSSVKTHLGLRLFKANQQTSSSSRDRKKPTPSAANYQAYESSTWAVDLTSWLV